MIERNDDRNRELVRKRIGDPAYWTWKKIGLHYKLSRPTALELFEKNAARYATEEEISKYRQSIEKWRKGVRKIKKIAK